jgi:hypothetical protein
VAENSADTKKTKPKLPSQENLDSIGKENQSRWQKLILGLDKIVGNDESLKLLEWEFTSLEKANVRNYLISIKFVKGYT